MKKLAYILIGLIIGASALTVQAQLRTFISLQLAPSPSNGNCLTTNGTDNTWGSCGSGTFPFTVQSWGNSTSTTLGFLQGFLSTASSTINASTTITGVLTASGGIFGNLTGTASLATALGANGANCSSGLFPLGVDASGASETCTDAWTEAENTAAGYTSNTGTVTNIATTFPILGGPITTTGTLTFGGLSTSTNPTISHLPYWTDVNTFGSVATTTLTASSPLSLSNPVFKVGGSNSTLTIDTSGAWSGTAGSLAANGANCSAGNYPLGVNALGAVEDCTAVGAGTSAFEIATTTNIAVPNLAYFTQTSGRTTLGSVATGTVSGTNGITVTGSRYAVGGALAIDCTVGSSSAAGCISTTDWTTFNNKQGTISANWPITLTGAAVGFNGLSTSSAPTIGQMPYWTGVNTFGSVATGTISVPTGLTITANRSAIGGAAAIALDTGYVIPLQTTLDAKALGATTLTIAGTAGQVTSSAGAQDLTANRTWTLSLPSFVQITNLTLTDSTTTRATTTNATSTNFHISSLFNFGGDVFDELVGTGLTISGGDLQTTLGTAIDISGETNLTGGLGLTLTDDDMACDTASGSVFGCLASADWTTFNNKESALTFSTGLTRSVNTITVDQTFTPTWTGAHIFNNITRSTTTSATSTNFFSTTASTTNLSFTNLLFDGVNGNDWADFCTKITGGAGLCDGTDATGAGGDFPFTPDTYGFGSQIVNATSTGLWLKGSPLGLIASSTFATNATTTNATTTNLSVSGEFDVDNLTSALTLTGSTGIFAEYTGTTCTNQFVRVLSALGVATCATVVATDVDLADLTATNGTLTFSGAYDGQTARTIGLNLGNANTWTAAQLFGYTATSSYSGGLYGSLVSAPYFHATSTTATSTFKGGFNSNIISCTEALETNSDGGIICGTDATGGGGGASDTHWATSTGAFTNAIFPNSGSLSTMVGIGTTTPFWPLQIASSTYSQLTLSDSGVLTNNHWSFRNAGGLFYLATSSPLTFSTSTVSAFSINANGIPTFPSLGTGFLKATNGLFSSQTTIDISADTNLAGDTENVLTGDALSIASTITRDTEWSGIDFLTGTAQGALSGEIVVGTTPGGELGGTWGTPTIDDSVTVTGWILGNATSTNFFSTTASSTNLFASAVTFGQNIFQLVQQTVTALGIWDFGGATSLEIPNSASPTLNAQGILALDTTSNNLVLATSTTGHVVIGGATTTLYSFSVASTSPDFASGGILEMPSHFLPQVVTAVWCKVDAGTSQQIFISDGTNDSNTVTCTTTGTQYAITTNNSFTAGEQIRTEFVTKSGTPDYLVVRWLGYRTSD